MSEQIVCPCGYNACLVIAAYLYDGQRIDRYRNTLGVHARNGDRRWPLADRLLLAGMQDNP